MLPVCTLYNLYIVEDQGFTVCEFQAVSGMKVWNEYGIELSIKDCLIYPRVIWVVVSKYLYCLPRPDLRNPECTSVVMVVPVHGSGYDMDLFFFLSLSS